MRKQANAPPAIGTAALALEAMALREISTAQLLRELERRSAGLLCVAFHFAGDGERWLHHGNGTPNPFMPGECREAWHHSTKGSPELLAAMSIRLDSLLKEVGASLRSAAASRERGREHWGA